MGRASRLHLRPGLQHAGGGQGRVAQDLSRPARTALEGPRRDRGQGAGVVLHAGAGDGRGAGAGVLSRAGGERPAGAPRQRAPHEPRGGGRCAVRAHALQLPSRAAASRRRADRLDRARADHRRHRRRGRRGARAAPARGGALLRIHAGRGPEPHGRYGARDLRPAHGEGTGALPAQVHRSGRGHPGLRSLDQDLRGHDPQPLMTENELLTCTGPATPMGKLFRRYWLPALLADELPEPDCPPVRVKLLGERLIAFRDTQGRLGLIDEFCAHRGVSLWFGRNEENGLRCSYHGWKYDVTGQCVEIPSEPDNPRLCQRMKLKSYPLVERGGVLWTYMGPAESRPPLPEHEWAMVPAANRFISKRWQECNYLQAMEGGLDSIHSTFLHRWSVEDDPLLKRDPASAAMIKGDPSPAFLPLPAPGGLRICTRRDVGEDRYFWRVTQFLMPCFNLFPPYGDNPRGGHAWVPMDDENCWVFNVDYHPERALNATELEGARDGRGVHVRLIDGTFLPVANRRNDYLIDRDAQKARRTFSGVLGVGVQDAAIQESMGAIADRPREHLVATDKGIVMTRRRLLDAAQTLARGEDPPGLEPGAQRVRAMSCVAPRERA